MALKTKIPQPHSRQGDKTSEMLLAAFGSSWFAWLAIVSVVAVAVVSAFSRSSWAHWPIGGDLGDHEWEESHFSGASDCAGDHALLFCRAARLAAWQDFAVLVDETAQDVDLFVINGVNFVDGQVADFASSSAFERAISASFHPHTGILIGSVILFCATIVSTGIRSSARGVSSLLRSGFFAHKSILLFPSLSKAN